MSFLFTESEVVTTGKTKRFENGEQLLELWFEFCDEIEKSGYKVIPSKTAFSKWLCGKGKGCDRRTIYNALNIYFPNIKEDFNNIRADIMLQGAMTGKYQSATTIFGLKNFCGWQDKPLTDEDISAIEKLDKLVEGITGEAKQ